LVNLFDPVIFYAKSGINVTNKTFPAVNQYCIFPQDIF